jgi:hypothetical protein
MVKEGDGRYFEGKRRGKISRMALKNRESEEKIVSTSLKKYLECQVTKMPFKGKDTIILR